MHRFYYFWLTMLAAMIGSAQEVLVLSNGDQIQGRVEKKEAGLIHFRSPVLGVLKLPEASVKQINADTPPASAKPAQPAATTPVVKPVLPKPTTPSVESVVPPRAKLVPAPKKAPPAAVKPKKWSGDLGFSYNKRKSEYERRSGNTIRRRTDDVVFLRGNFRAQWKSAPHEIEWRGNYAYATNEELRDKKSVDHYSVSQQYRFDFSPDFFVQTKSTYESDFLRHIVHDFWQSVGIGWHLVNNDRFTLTAVPGVAWHYLDQKDLPVEKEIVPVFNQNARWNITKDFSLFQAFDHLGDLDRYKYNLSVGLDNRLIKNFFIRFEYRYEFDTFVEKESKPFMRREVITSLRYRF